MSDLNALKKLEEEIQEFNDIELETMSSDYLSSKRGKFIKLLDETVEPIKFDKKDNRSFEFEDAVFVKTISFISDKNTPPDIIVEVIYASGYSKSNFRFNVSKAQENRNYIIVNGFIKSFNIKSDRMIRDEKVKRVIVNGLTADNFNLLVTKASEFMDSYKTIKTECKKTIDITDQNLKSTQDKKSEVELQIKDLNVKNLDLIKQVALLEVSLQKSEEQFETSSKKKVTLDADLDLLKEKQFLLQNSIEELTQTNSNLNKTISNLKNVVETLSTRKDLYAETMSDFISESGSQLKIYYLFIFITIIGLAWMGIDSVDKINELVAEYKEILKLNANANSWNLIALRLPYASIILAVFGGLTALINTLANKVFEIHSQKRHIIGLSVLARDVNSAAKHGVNLTEEQTYQYREQLKFELLSDSLLGQSFKPLLEKRLLRNLETKKEQDDNENNSLIATSL